MEFADAGEDEEPLSEILCRVKMMSCGKGLLCGLKCVIMVGNVSCRHAILHHSLRSCCTLPCLASPSACMFLFDVLSLSFIAISCMMSCVAVSFGHGSCHVKVSFVPGRDNCFLLPLH